MRGVLDDIINEVCDDDVDAPQYTAAERAAFLKEQLQHQTLVAAQCAAADAFNLISFSVRSLVIAK